MSNEFVATENTESRLTVRLLKTLSVSLFSVFRFSFSGFSDTFFSEFSD